MNQNLSKLLKSKAREFSGSTKAMMYGQFGSSESELIISGDPFGLAVIFARAIARVADINHQPVSDTAEVFCNMIKTMTNDEYLMNGVRTDTKIIHEAKK